MAIPYERSFFEDREGSIRSARAVVPIVLEWIRPASMIDVGCGVGSWLKVFSEHGVEGITGVDGDYVDRDLLLIPKERFVSADLTRPLAVDGSFDFAMSLEVAEHLPEASAAAFIASLTKLAPVVFFGAAIPFQGGVHHINEQWPDYWMKLFAARGYRPADCIRPRIWANKDVSYFYAQNAILYVHEGAFDRYPQLAEACRNTNIDQLSLVHPQQYLPLAEAMNRISRAVPQSVRTAARKLLGL